MAGESDAVASGSNATQPFPSPSESVLHATASSSPSLKVPVEDTGALETTTVQRDSASTELSPSHDSLHDGIVPSSHPLLPLSSLPLPPSPPPLPVPVLVPASITSPAVPANDVMQEDAPSPAPHKPAEPSINEEKVATTVFEKPPHPTGLEPAHVQHPVESTLLSCDEMLTLDIDIIKTEPEDQASASLLPKLEPMDASDTVSAASPSAATAAATGTSSSASRKRGAAALSSDPASRKSKSSFSASSDPAATSPTQDANKARAASKPLVVRLPRRPRDPQWAFSHLFAMDGSIVEDGRRCLFCRLPEDSTGELLGRLLPVDAGQFAHLQCCLWSSEVFEGNMGLLDKVPNARTRAATTRCPHCNMLNASVNCCYKRCMRSYHLPCLLAAGGYVCVCLPATAGW
jgi:hypothetical protein